MGARVSEATWNERRVWIEKQLQSGCSAERFCRENELNLNSFNSWKRHVARGDKAVHRKTDDSTKKAMVVLSSAFTQVPIQVGSQAKASPHWIEISLADGMVIRVPSSNLPALKLVLGVIGTSQEITHA